MKTIVRYTPMTASEMVERITEKPKRLRAFNSLIKEAEDEYVKLCGFFVHRLTAELIMRIWEKDQE